MERNNVLLKITDLRQYFPVGKKKGLYVKANDGISLNIYEGETVGLVGESGCGKSTFGRTLLQLYRQTDGKTMYYGASRDELAPEYIEKTIRHLPHGLHELAALEKKRDEMQKVYDAADEQKRLHMHNDLTAAKKAANDAYLNIVNVIGGFGFLLAGLDVTERYVPVFLEVAFFVIRIADDGDWERNVRRAYSAAE